MGTTILEELTAIRERINESTSVATIAEELRTRLYVVTTLLMKGWPADQTIEPLLAQFGSLTAVPDCPVPPLRVPKWEHDQGEAEAPIPHDQQSLDEALKALRPFNLSDGEDLDDEEATAVRIVQSGFEVTERGLEKIFAGEARDHRIYGFLTVQVCDVEAEFSHDEARVRVMLTDYPDLPSGPAGEPLVVLDTVTLPAGGRKTIVLTLAAGLVVTDEEGRLGWPVRIRLA